MPLLNFPDTKTWLAARKQWIGASESSGIIGANKYSSALKVYTGKVEDQEEPETSKMRAGLIMERAIAELWASEFDYQLEPHCPHPRVWKIDRLPIAATPDAFAQDDGGRYLVEVKNPSPELLKIDTKDGGWKQGPPLHYLVQVQHQLWCLSECCEHVDHGILVGYFGSDDVRMWPVEKDPAFWASMEPKLLEFWNQHVTLRVPPGPDQYTDSTMMARAWPTATNGKAVEVPAHVLIEYREKKQLLKIAEDAADLAKVQLQSALGAAEFGTVLGAIVATWKNQVAQHEAKPARSVTSRPLKLTKAAEGVA